MENNSLLALIWDFDGTIADTRERNLDVTRSILKAIGKVPNQYEFLKDKNTYTDAILAHKDWRDFYQIDMDLTFEETTRLGGLWGQYQLRSKVKQELYPGISDVIMMASVPQGVFSVNSKYTIKEFLDEHGLAGYFSSIVGYEQLNGAGKPNPQGLIKCVSQMGLLKKEGDILYIGDHETDIIASERANTQFRETRKPIRVRSVHASYIYGNNLPEEVVPDLKAEKPSGIAEIILEYKLDEVVQDFISKNP